jgi:acetyltransferase
MPSSLRPFFEATGVAVIGASANPRKLSHGILKNLIDYNYQGGIYPVNPGSEDILGRKCYADIADVPNPVDLAVIILPAPATPEALEACGKRGIKAVVIISGGFKETGAGGTELETQCLKIAADYEMRLIGPNCVGLVNLHNGLNTTFISGLPDVGGIGFLSQSGAVCGGVVDLVQGKKVGFSHFLSLGNEADVTETDIIEYLGDDPNTTVIAAYVEQIRDGRRFLEVAREVSRKKPIVLLKAGRTSAGARAVSSHTGSLAGSYSAYQAAFKQAGVIEVDTVAELFDVSMCLDFQPLPTGNRAVILTNAGGPAALASDSLSAHGIFLEDLEADTREVLRQHLNPAAQVGNPVDMLGGAEPADYAMAVKQLISDRNVDIVIPMLVPQSLVNPAGVAQAIVDASQGSTRPVLTCIMGDISVTEARLVLQGNRMPMFVHPESMGRVLKAMLDYADWRSQNIETITPLTNVDRSAAEKIIRAPGASKVFGEAETRPILAAYGLSMIKGGLATNPVDAATLAEEIGFPVVMKIVSPQILHKSDIGGIILNLQNETEVMAAYERMFIDIGRKMPEAKLEGVLIEQMAGGGQEVIVGMRRDPGFGPLLMFGLGGVYVELFKDVSFRVAPISEKEALEMINETGAGKLLRGFRGVPASDLDAVVSCIQRLGQLALDFPEIAEVEVNPLLVHTKGEGALVLDGRIILSE